MKRMKLKRIALILIIGIISMVSLVGCGENKILLEEEFESDFYDIGYELVEIGLNSSNGIESLKPIDEFNSRYLLNEIQNEYYEEIVKLSKNLKNGLDGNIASLDLVDKNLDKMLKLYINFKTKEER